MILSIACLNLLVRFFLSQSTAILVLGLALVPAAPVLGIHPWVIIITLLATSGSWFLPSQTTSYLAAYSATDGRLFSHGQARTFAFVYTGMTIVGLLLVLPYWSWLGLL